MPSRRPRQTPSADLAAFVLLGLVDVGMGPWPTPPPPGPWWAFGLVRALLWGLGGYVIYARGREQLARQRSAQLGKLGRCFKPQASRIDAEDLRSPYQVQLGMGTLEGAQPGGSFVDWLTLSETRLGLVIGDATGWNTPALVYRGLADAFWRARAPLGASPAATLLVLNRLLGEYIAQGSHVTAFVAEIDLMSGAVSYASAAHAGAYVMRADGELILLGGRGVPLGVGQELFAGRLEESQVRLESGESLWLFTDGLLKVENAAGEAFGFERLASCLRAEAGLEAELLVSRVKKAVLAHAKATRLPDDAAMMCLRLASPLLATGSAGIAVPAVAESPDLAAAEPILHIPQ